MMKKYFFATRHDYGMLLLRVAAGLMMLPYGFTKVGLDPLGGSISGTIGFFGSIGVPSVIAVLVIVAETVGAISLVLGFCTRFCAASLAVVMLGALYVIRGTPFMTSLAIPLLFLVMFLVLLKNGAGAWSLDSLIAKKQK